ncbi:helix-turn-helix domain-containing protein [Paracoccus pacificus]|uniref:Helix-turn-helix domain-containing protein n=1 Tax=Paracoccus pacificus TaxID=1463598 RepID=A0ABW4R3J0_9RHOB
MSLSHRMIQRAPRPGLRGLVDRLSAYRADGTGSANSRQAARPVLPLIVNFGPGYDIALGSGAASRHEAGFVAGLFAGPVNILTPAGAESVQVDLTPLGAACFWGGAGADLAGRMAGLDDMIGAEGARLRDRLAATDDWWLRLDLAEAFVAGRLRHRPSAAVLHACRRITRAGGDLRIGVLADEIGWSRRHLANRFRAEIGTTPKLLARLIRFDRAQRLSRGGSSGGWADIAAACGFTDQAHLVREFRALAGDSPGAWHHANRSAQVTKPQDGGR